MLIRVDRLKNEIDKLQKLVDEYEINTLNLYNVLNYSSNYWSDANSIQFYDEIKSEKMKTKQFISEINDIKKVYLTLIEKYEHYGTIIQCETKNKNSVINSMNQYLLKLREIINLYRNLDLSFCPYEARILKKHLSTLIKNYNSMIKVKNKIYTYFNEIENIEKEIRLQISKIDIQYLTETEIKKYL